MQENQIHGNISSMIRSKLPVPVDEDDDDTGAPQISLAEILDDLDIGEDAIGDPGDFMAEGYIFFSSALHGPVLQRLVSMLDLSSKSFGLWAGLGTAAFVGYCIYFDSKRRSHPDFKRKLREKRKAAVKGQSKSSGPQLPDFSDQEAVQRFFLQEVQMGEELLATGDIQNGEGRNMRYEILNKMACLTSSSCRS